MTEMSDVQRFSVVDVQLYEEIGRGGIGVVYRGSWKGAPCAVKSIEMLEIPIKDRRRMKERFMTECERSSALRHPNIVQFLGVCISNKDTFPSLVMELMHSNLTSLIEVNSKIPLEMRFSFIHDVTKGLNYLHTYTPPIIHRDLSTNNVLVSAGMVAKIGDLGTMGFIDESGERKLSGRPWTNDFMAPEVLFDRPVYSTAMDVFSFACVCLHTLSHKWPTPSQPVEVDPHSNELIARSEAQRRSAYMKEIDNDMRTLVTSCLHNNPDKRPSIVEVCIQLEHILAKQQHPPSLTLLDIYLSHSKKIEKLKEEINFKDEQISLLKTWVNAGKNELWEKMIKCKHFKSDEYLQQLLMAKYKLPASGNCDVLIHLVRECSLTVGACLDVAMMNDEVEAALMLLRQECPICYEKYMRDEMVNMIHCDHAVCKECFVAHYSLMLGEKSIKHFNCLVCGEPDMSSETIDMDLYLQMFSGLIQAHMSKAHYDLFTQKINEHTLIKDPNFGWCIQCPIGYICDNPNQVAECPNAKCRQQMCFKCKKPWEDQHVELTCEEFTQWKKNNDPEVQRQGLAAYLNKEGIVCPACKFTYALARGGCMHYRCTQCPAEFCGGCNELFRKDCTKYQSCRWKGLHAHHPRNCLFYLRDKSVENLQKLLNDNNVEYDTKPPEGQVMAEAKKEIKALQGQVAEEQPIVSPAAAPVLKCHVMLQKETVYGCRMDKECGGAVQNGHAGLCEKHYMEYLVFKINQNHIDPLPIVHEIGHLQNILTRDDVKVPDQQYGEGEEQYAERLRELIKEKLPLKDIKGIKGT